MKRLNLLLIVLIFATNNMFAQVPDAINFQAVARASNGDVMANMPIMIQLSILDGSVTGPRVYKEIRSLTTNGYGSFSFQIGVDPYMKEGDFGSIAWEKGQKYMKVDYDPSATLKFDLTLGTIAFASVPYAFAAGAVSFIDLTGIKDGDVLVYNSSTQKFEPGSFSVSGIEWSNILSKPAFATVATSGSYNDLKDKPDMSTYLTSFTEVDGSVTNEIQTLSLSGNSLSLSNGGGNVVLAAGTAYTGGTGITVSGGVIASTVVDTKLSETEVDAFVANNGYLSSEVDGSITNEIQTLSLSGNSLSLSNGGGSVTLAGGTSYTAGTGIAISGGAISSTVVDTKLSETEVDDFVANNGYLSSEVDGSVTNEIQDIMSVLNQGEDAGGKKIVNISKQGIGTAAPDGSAILELNSTTMGFLPPAMTTSQRNAINSPATGLLIFNTSTKRPNYFDGTQWMNFDGTATSTQLQYFDAKEYCLYCGTGTYPANYTVADGLNQEMYIFILDNDRDMYPDNDEFDITLQVQGENDQKQFMMLVHYPGQGVVGKVAVDGSSFYYVSKLDAGVSIYAGTDPGWCMGPNYGSGGATAMFALTSSNSIIKDYLKWNDAEEDKYVGMSLSSKFDNKPLYGWIRLSKPFGTDYIVVKDWAYNPNPGQPMVTGSRELPVLAYGISISSQIGLNTISTSKGTLQLTVSVSPSDALIKTAEWSFTGTCAGGISITKNGLVTGLVNGNYTVIATTQDGTNKTATFNIVVSGQTPVLATSITIGEQDGATTITVDDGYLLMFGNPMPFSTTVKTVSWSVNNSNAVIDNTGKLLAKRNGVVVVTATANDGSGTTANYTVSISNQVVRVESISITSAGNLDKVNSNGGTLQMSASVLPIDAANKTVTWSLQNNTIGASISTTGLLQAGSQVGKVTVVAVSEDGSNISVKKEISIIN